MPVGGFAPRAAAAPALGLPPVGGLGLLGPAPLLASGPGEAVGVGRAGLATAGWLPRAEFELPEFPRVQRRANSGVVFAAAEQMCDLAC